MSDPRQKRGQKQGLNRGQNRGLRSHLSGLSAEHQAARAYEALGFEVVEERWRGEAGEIDLILRQGATWVFAEVKKSTDFETAATRISQKQVQRIRQSATLYLAQIPSAQVDEVRLDAVLIDAEGQVEILENGLGFE